MNTEEIEAKRMEDWLVKINLITGQSFDFIAASIVNLAKVSGWTIENSAKKLLEFAAEHGQIPLTVEEIQLLFGDGKTVIVVDGTKGRMQWHDGTPVIDLKFTAPVKVEIPELKPSMPTQKDVVGEWKQKQCRPIRNVASKTGRNSLCPCGSGQKYKKCCLTR